MDIGKVNYFENIYWRMSMFRFWKNNSKEVVGGEVIIEEAKYRATFNDDTSMEFKTVKSASVQFGVSEFQCKKLMDGGYKTWPKWAKDADIRTIVKL